MQITIKANFSEIYATLGKLPERVRDAATAAALNRTIEQGRTKAIREITSVYNVKANFVRSRLKIIKARRSGGAYAITASLSGGSGKRSSANIIAFDARKVDGGVSVRVKKSGGRKIIGSAFIANKDRTVFVRLPGTIMASRSKYKGKHAEQIKPVRTLDVPQMFTTQVINKAIEQALLGAFPRIFAHEAAFFTKRFNDGKL